VIEAKQSLSEAHWETWKIVQGRRYSHTFQVPVNKENHRYFRIRNIEEGAGGEVNT
jgi:hypothetical protein